MARNLDSCSPYTGLDSSSRNSRSRLMKIMAGAAVFVFSCLTGSPCSRPKQASRFLAVDWRNLFDPVLLLPAARALRFSPGSAESDLFGSSCGLLPDPQLLRQRFPLAVNERFGLGVHHNFFRPGTHKSLACPFAGRVNSHLRSVIWQPRGVVERIHRAQRELDVALGIDVVEHFQGN